MSHPSEPTLLVLHALRLKGFAEDASVGAITGLDVDDVGERLKELAAEDLVVRRDGRISGWSLTPAGRIRHVELVSAELATCGGRDSIYGSYAQFLEINREMLAVCTSWQVRDGDGAQTVNDHTDDAYDAAVVQRLIGIHDRVRPVTVALRDILTRFEGYGPRLRSALEKVLGGEHEWFTKPMIDSYHTVWFELHEDLLSTLGLERDKEDS